MKKILSLIAALLGMPTLPVIADIDKYELDYEKMAILDAEELAEQGIKEVYKELIPEFSKYVSNPLPIEEVISSDLPSYKIKFQGDTYVIYSPEIEGSDEESWGRATFYFFQIVNSQLNNSDKKFYAINAGNDLGGLFLTREEVELAKKTLQKKSDWPYFPKLEKPWYGLEH